MALTDPLSVTIGSAISLPRVSDDGLASKYWSSDRMVREAVSSQLSNSRGKTMVRVDKDIVAADPLTDRKSVV